MQLLPRFLIEARYPHSLEGGSVNRGAAVDSQPRVPQTPPGYARPSRMKTDVSDRLRSLHLVPSRRPSVCVALFFRPSTEPSSQPRSRPLPHRGPQCTHAALPSSSSHGRADSSDRARTGPSGRSAERMSAAPASTPGRRFARGPPARGEPDQPCPSPVRLRSEKPASRRASARRCLTVSGPPGLPSHHSRRLYVRRLRVLRLYGSLHGCRSAPCRGAPCHGAPLCEAPCRLGRCRGPLPQVAWRG